jgi:hypothetical protein
MKEAWRGLTFSDTELSESKKTRHPAAPAKRSGKASSKMADEDSGIEARRFSVVMDHLAAISEVELVLKECGPNRTDITFKRMKKLSPLQSRALQLVKEIPRYPAT